MTDTTNPATSERKGEHVGYIRVSTVEQNTARQLAGLNLDQVFEEKASAKSIDRPVWTECLRYVRKRDTLHIHSLDRVCRSGATDAVTLVEELTGRGVGVVFHKEGMTFNGSMTAAQKGVLGILASVAQMERELINERRREGQAAARAAGKHMGRPQAEVDEERLRQLYMVEKMSVTAIAKDLGASRQVIYRRLDALGLR